MIKRLRIKFICINMLIVTVVLGIVFSLVLHFTYNSLEMESIRMMQAVGMEHGPRRGPRESFLIVHLNEDGTIREVQGDDYNLTQDQLVSLVNSVQNMEEPVGKLEVHQLRYLRAPAPVGSKVVFSDTSFERSMMTNLVRDCLLIGAIALALFYAIIVLLAKWAIKPMERAWIQQKKFVADASHELKTPLTVILTNAELLQCEEYDPEQKRIFTQNVLTMGHQMKKLVERLLELAKVDTGVERREKKEVDLSAVTAEVVLSFEVSFFENGLLLNSEIEEGLTVLGVEDQLRQISEILLDNAIKYSKPGQTQIRLHRQGHHAVLMVSNPGESMSEEQLRDIFKRFYRADQARSRTGSFGLGLSIAHRIVQDHGGKIKAESENGMNTFTVSIPLIK